MIVSLSCHGQVVYEHQIQALAVKLVNVGSGSGRDVCVLKQDALLLVVLSTQGYEWVPVRVEVCRG